MIDIKNKLKNEENVYGTWCTIPSPEVSDIISNAGLDFSQTQLIFRVPSPHQRQRLALLLT